MSNKTDAAVLQAIANRMTEGTEQFMREYLRLIAKR